MADEWIPNYIKRDINYKPRDILTAQEYNAILNLLITQGDYNSSWLEYFQKVIINMLSIFVNKDIITQEEYDSIISGQPIGE